MAAQPGLHRRLHPVEQLVRGRRRHRRPGRGGVQGVVRELSRRWADAPLAEERAQHPGGLAGTVQAIAGLDESAALVRPTSKPAAPPPAVFVNGTPCSTYWDQIDTSTPANGTSLPNIYGSPTPYAPCGYTPQQVRGAYGVPSGLTGQGVTVAIIDAYASPTIVARRQRRGRPSGASPRFKRRPVQPGRRPRHVSPAPEQEAGPAGLVR